MTLLFPFLPDWTTSLKVTRTFKTDVITSRSGKEQRRALRNRPRKSLEFAITEFGARVNLFARSLNKQLGGTPIYMADYSRHQVSTSSLAAGAKAFQVDASQLWMGSAIVLLNLDSGAMEVHQVASVSGLTVTLADPASTLAWPAGTVVYPALLGTLGSEISGSRPSDGAITATITFDVTPTSEPEINPPIAETLFNGREVFLAKPDWGQAINVTFAHPFETVDYGQGVIAYKQPIGFAHMTQQATWLQMSADDMASIENVFVRAKGQRGEYYMPTWTNDLSLAADSSGATFQVAGTDVFDAFAGDTVFDALCICFTDGTFEFARVSSVTKGGSNSQINLTAAPSVPLTAAAVAMICWMPVWRFASDAMTSEWITNTIAQTQLNSVSLEDLPPES